MSFPPARSPFLRAAAAAAALAFCHALPAAEPAMESADAAPASRFVRVVRDAKGEPAALETATVRYVVGDPAKAGGPKGKDLAPLTVDLVGVTHVGDKEYFGGIAGQLEDYDAVLYELVAPEGVVPQRGANAGALPGTLKDLLGLEYQTEAIDYTRPNFIHADLTPAQMAAKMRERGQTGMTLALDVFGEMFAEAQKRQAAGTKSGLESVGLLTLLFDPQRDLKLRRAFALELETADDGLMLGETAHRMLISDRNEAAVGVLRRRIDAGDRRIAIFYGAGHMADLERRLLDDFGLVRQGVQWRPAWDLSGKPAE